MFSWTGHIDQPIVVAHRGLSAAAPENTLAAFALALKQGADAVELDVRCTADGEVIVIHDGTLDRTTDGRGRVREMSYAEILECSAGGWFGRGFARERVPLLSDVIALVDGRIGINIEVKEPPRRARYDIIERCLTIIRAQHAHRIILFSSFHHPYVRRAKELEPRIAAGVLHHPVKHFRIPPSRLASASGAEYFFCAKSSLRRRMVRNAHDHQVRLGVYTVNQVKSLERAMRAGVDLVFTDDPVTVKGAIERFS